MPRLPLIIACLTLLGGPVAAQAAGGLAGAQTLAEIRIDFPQGELPVVAVEPDDRRIRLELPKGAVFPLDFAASSGGLLRGGKVTPLDRDRLLLELEMSVGLLDRIVFDAEGVLLRFQSRFAVDRAAGADEGSYRLGPDDRVVITVHNHAELNSTLTVSRSGTITAPLVGDVAAAGLTPQQLAARLAELLGRSYLVDPQVDVDVSEYRSQWVMVTGEVRLPGRVPLRGGTRLKEVLSEAGGFTPTSGEEILISRRVAESNEFAAQRVKRAQFESGEIDPVLNHGDIVEVTESAFCYVQGEVRSPSRVPVERGLTLMRAITMVGGLTEWANQKEVKILYADRAARGERVVNVKRIIEGKDPDPVLEGGEVIVVKRRFF